MFMIIHSVNTVAALFTPVMRLIICAFIVILSSCGSISQMKRVKDFGPNPGRLKMYVHKPAHLPDTATYPMVVALHGCYQNARRMARQSGWNKLAKKHNFILMYPQQRRFNNPAKCFNWFNKKDTDANNGETASVKAMINYCFHNYSVDSSRVFVYGLSAGAAMGVSVMANFPEVFKAGAILAGAPYGMAGNIFEASGAMLRPRIMTPSEWGTIITDKHPHGINYPQLVVVHGLRDKVVNIQSSRELVKQWTFLHKTNDYPFKIMFAFEGNPLVYKLLYGESEDNCPIVFYMLHKTGHKLPVNPGRGVNKGGRRGIFAADRNFFSTYYIAKDFRIIP